MSHIFLSYDHEDEAIMRRVRDGLKAEGIPVWTDEKLKPGLPSWKLAVGDAIKQAGGLVVILTPESSRSRWVHAEISFAETHRVRVFPLVARGDPEDVIPFGLTESQWVDMRDGSVPKDLIDALCAHLEIESLSQRLERERLARTLPPRYGQLSASDLGELFGFTLEELTLNRGNRLSRRQHRRIILQAGGAVVVGVPTLAVVFYVVLLKVFDLSSWLALAIAGSLFAFLMLSHIRNIFFPQVKTATGPLRRVDHVARYFIRTGDIKLTVSKSGWQHMGTDYRGDFRAYYVRGVPDLLSIEPWYDLPPGDPHLRLAHEKRV